MRCFMLSLIATSLLAAASFAQDPKAAAETTPALPPPVKVVLFPRAAASPVLQHRLLPALPEQIDEDAAVYYSKAMLFRTESPAHNKQNERIAQLLDLAPDKFPLSEARELLSQQRSALSYVHLGAKRCFF